MAAACEVRIAEQAFVTGRAKNARHTGYIETQIAIDYWNSFPDPAAERRRAYDLQPPRRIGRPEEIGWTAVFLASDEAPFLNAECIVVDGGSRQRSGRPR